METTTACVDDAYHLDQHLLKGVPGRARNGHMENAGSDVSRCCDSVCRAIDSAATPDERLFDAVRVQLAGCGR
jgi:hypothetical protein